MVTAAPVESTLPFGLTFFEAVSLLIGFGAIVATVAGAIAAVIISLNVERGRREREGQLQLFRALLTLRRSSGDPAWTIAFNAVPVDFNGQAEIVEAWRALLAKFNHRPTAENKEHHYAEQDRLCTAMLFKMAQFLKISITEGEIGGEAYLAEGWAERDKLYRESLVALCIIAAASQRSADAAEAMLQNLNPPEEGA